MSKLLQINVVNAVLSTGRIANDIAKVAQKRGWECYMCYGRKTSSDSVSHDIRIGGVLNTCFHYLEHRLFDNEGLSSRLATRMLIKRIRRINPDIIHIHNIHDHFINYPQLLTYISKSKIPLVWTLHDCWAFTGGCMYYDMYSCHNWRDKCTNCPERRALLRNQSKKQLYLKKSLISALDKVVFVPVSDWLAKDLRLSLCMNSNAMVKTIHNGIDTKLFSPSGSTGHMPSDKFCILGVAAVWHERKGLSDFIKLRSLLDSRFYFLLIGLSDNQINSLPEGIYGIKKTSSVSELVQYYSEASVFVNPTYSDNFPTTNIEALACGTPVITYDTGGSPEAIDEKTGIVIPKGDLWGLREAILHLMNHPLSSSDCVKRAVSLFNKDLCFNAYVSIYEELLLK